MQSIGSVAGFCQKHQMDKMFMGTAEAIEPTCIKCDAESRPKEGRTVIAEDPGEGYFHKGGKSEAKITVLDETHGGNGKVVEPQVPSLTPVILEQIVGNAVGQLKRLPMPDDIKEFKRVQKIIKTLQSLLEKSNG